MSGVGQAGGGNHQVSNEHQHRHAHKHGHGQGKGLKMGQNEEFRALKDAKKAGELEGPMGQAVKDLAAKLRAGETSESAVVSSEATLAASEKQEISVEIEEKLAQVVTSETGMSTELKEKVAAMNISLEQGFADNAKFFEI